jgi:predicted enzyme related to lactoylglutathione lyase
MARHVFQVEIRARALRNAVPFYRAVFDWKVYPAADNYALVDTGALPIVGILETTGKLGVASYLLVEDCAREAARAVALGGRISTPLSEVPAGGLFAGVTDPWGTEVWFWQPYAAANPQPRGSGANPVSYIEISAPDLTAATTFYGELAGWSFESTGPRSVIARDCGLAHGIGVVEGSPGILDYVTVASLEEVATRVQNAGGGIDEPRHDAPKRVHFRDLDGVGMGAIQRP